MGMSNMLDIFVLVIPNSLEYDIKVFSLWRLNWRTEDSLGCLSLTVTQTIAVLISQDSEFHTLSCQQVFMKSAPSTCRVEGTEPLCVSTAPKSNRAQRMTCCSTECALAVLRPGLSRRFHRGIKEVIYEGYPRGKGFHCGLCSQALSAGRKRK